MGPVARRRERESSHGGIRRGGGGSETEVPLDIALGRKDPGYEAHMRCDPKKATRNASPEYRYRMLARPWKRETGEDMAEGFEELGRCAGDSPFPAPGTSTDPRSEERS